VSVRQDEQGFMEHYPRQADLFEFDDEVARAFDDMAERSIPMYRAQHELHCEMALRHALDYNRNATDNYCVLDVGCSTGNFMKQMFDSYTESEMLRHLYMVGLDPSGPMCDIANAKLQEVNETSYATYRIEQSGVEGLRNIPDYVTFDAVNMSYVFQFLPVDRRHLVFRDLHRILKPNGVLIISQKFTYRDNSSDSVIIDDLVQNAYIDFRLKNGYSISEIEAKNRALKNAMWLQSDIDFRGQISSFGFRVYPTTRWLSFGSYLAIK